MDIYNARYRYEHDPIFHRVVDTIVDWIVTMQVSPSEARDAAMYACLRVEERRTDTSYIVRPWQG